MNMSGFVFCVLLSDCSGYCGHAHRLSIIRPLEFIHGCTGTPGCTIFFVILFLVRSTLILQRKTERKRASKRCLQMPTMAVWTLFLLFLCNIWHDTYEISSCVHLFCSIPFWNNCNPTHPYVTFQRTYDTQYTNLFMFSWIRARRTYSYIELHLKPPYMCLLWYRYACMKANWTYFPVDGILQARCASCWAW